MASSHSFVARPRRTPHAARSATVGLGGHAAAAPCDAGDQVGSRRGGRTEARDEQGLSNEEPMNSQLSGEPAVAHRRVGPQSPLARDCTCERARSLESLKPQIRGTTDVNVQ